MRQRGQRRSAKKELYYILCIIAVAIILILSIFAPGGYLEMRKLRLELQGQKMYLKELERSNKERMKTIEALRSDKNILEKEARKMGYARKDEIIQQLPDETGR